jgi:hypothetical protein
MRRADVESDLEGRVRDTSSEAEHFFQWRSLPGKTRRSRAHHGLAREKSPACSNRSRLSVLANADGDN